MSHQGTPSLDDLSAAIAAIHDAGTDAALWPAMLERMSGLFEVSVITTWMQDPSGGFRDIYTQEHVEGVTRDYAEYYGRLDTLRPAVVRAPVGTILTNDMVMPRPEFVRTEFYADFADRYGLHSCMQAHIFDGPGCSGYASLGRTNRFGTFERGDVRLLGLLLPHLRRAMRTQLHLAALGVERDCAREALDHLRDSVLVVDAQAHILYANAAAEALLRAKDGLSVEPASGGRRLRAVTPGRTSALRCLVTRAAAGREGRADAPFGAAGNGALRLDRAAGGSLLLCIAPLRAGAAWNASPRPAALLLCTPGDAVSPSPSLLRALYDLTPAEAAVAVQIAQGQGVKDAAEALCIAPSTLRWHLQRVFDKTDTARQAELTRLVERLGAVAGHG